MYSDLFHLLSYNEFDVILVCSHVPDYSLCYHLLHLLVDWCAVVSFVLVINFFNIAELIKHADVMALETTKVVGYIIEHAQHMNWHVRTCTRQD
jgi:hypothetical protein